MAIKSNPSLMADENKNSPSNLIAISTLLTIYANFNG